MPGDDEPVKVSGQGRPRLDRQPVEKVDLAVGDRVKFEAEKAPYRVRAVSADGRWVICTKPFNPRRTVLYTVIDFESGVRGPDDRIFCSGYETDESCAAAMTQFEAGRWQVSVRRDLPLDIERIDRSRRPQSGAIAP